MPRVMSILLFGFAGLPAMAQDLTSSEAEALSRIIFHTCIDIHEDIGCENVFLLKSLTDDQSADLIILPDFRDEEADGTPHVIARDIAFNGPLFGMAPWVEERDTEGFSLHSEQIGMGRQPWSEQLTIVWRDDAFVVAGFTFGSYDRILNNHFSCDINLLTGEYVSEVWLFDMETETDDVTRSEGRTDPLRITLADWATAWAQPDLCEAEANVYYSQ